MGKHNEEGFEPIMGQSKILGCFYDKRKLTTNNFFQCYVVSKIGRVSFYKDQKSAKSQPEATFRAEPALELQGANVEIASDYTKKKHVFRIK
jgi:spectrin beta